MDSKQLIRLIGDVDQDDIDFTWRLVCIGCGRLLRWIMYHGQNANLEKQVEIAKTLIQALSDYQKETDRITHLTSMPYSEYLETPEWKAVRKFALLMSGYRCSVCGSSGELQVHHITYERRGNEKLDDLEVLCTLHHRERHGK